MSLHTYFTVSALVLSLGLLPAAGWAQRPVPGGTSAGAPVRGGEMPEDDTRRPAMPQLGLDRLAAYADTVIHAEVEGRETRMVNRNVETTYRLRVLETLMGGEGLERSTDGTVEITVRGGAMEGLPIAQVVRGNAYLLPDEEVILFLDTHPERYIARSQAERASRGMEPLQIDPRSRLATSPRIVGRAQGRFTVMTLPTGHRYVTRLSPLGAVPDDATLGLMRQYHREMLMAELGVEGARPLTAPVDRPSLQRAAMDAATPTSRAEAPSVEAAAAQAEVEAQAAPRGGIKPADEPIVIPFNQDALTRPVEIGAFRTELQRAIESRARARR